MLDTRVDSVAGVTGTFFPLPWDPSEVSFVYSLYLQPTQIGKTTVAYPAIKRLLIHIFALWTLKISLDAMKYCN